MEAEIVRMGLNLFHGGEDACGTVRNQINKIFWKVNQYAKTPNVTDFSFDLVKIKFNISRQVPAARRV